MNVEILIDYLSSSNKDVSTARRRRRCKSDDYSFPICGRRNEWGRVGWVVCVAVHALLTKGFSPSFQSPLKPVSDPLSQQAISLQRDTSILEVDFWLSESRSRRGVRES